MLDRIRFKTWWLGLPRGLRLRLVLLYPMEMGAGALYLLALLLGAPIRGALVHWAGLLLAAMLLLPTAQLLRLLVVALAGAAMGLGPYRICLGLHAIRPLLSVPCLPGLRMTLHGLFALHGSVLFRAAQVPTRLALVWTHVSGLLANLVVVIGIASRQDLVLPFGFTESTWLAFGLANLLTLLGNLPRRWLQGPPVLSPWNDGSLVLYFLRGGDDAARRFTWESRMLRAIDLENQGRLGDAVTELEAAAELASSPHPRLALAEALLRAGRVDDAERVLRQTSSRWPRDESARFALATLLATRGENQQASELMAPIQPGRHRPESVLLKARLLGAGGDALAATDELAGLLDADGTQLELHQQMVEWSVLTGSAWREQQARLRQSLAHPQALACRLAFMIRGPDLRPDPTAVQALDQQPWHGAGMALRVEWYRHLAASGRHDLAEPFLRGLLTRRPDDGLLLLHFGVLLSSQGRPVEGARYLWRAVELDPRSVFLLGVLAVCMQASEPERAAELAHELAARSSQDGLLLPRCCAFAATVRKIHGLAFALRLQELLRTLGLGSETSDRDLAVSWMALGKYPQAAALLSQHQDLESRCLRADVLIRLGDHRQASTSLAGLDPQLLPMPALPVQAVSLALGGEETLAEASWQALLERCEHGYWLACHGNHALALLPDDARQQRWRRALESRHRNLPVGLRTTEIRA